MVGEQTPGGTNALRCDFCGRWVARVQRVALDQGYDRLAEPHVVQYACSECSEAKERSRLKLPTA